MIVGNAGILVSRVVYVKQNGEKTFIIADAAMNDLIRPTLYDAWHDIMPVVSRGRATACARPTWWDRCVNPGIISQETGPCRALAAGDLIAVMTTGAYGAVQASTTTIRRPLVAEILVKGDRFAIVRPRQSCEDLVGADRLAEVAVLRLPRSPDNRAGRGNPPVSGPLASQNVLIVAWNDQRSRNAASPQGPPRQAGPGLRAAVGCRFPGSDDLRPSAALRGERRLAARSGCIAARILALAAILFVGFAFRLLGVPLPSAGRRWPRSSATIVSSTVRRRPGSTPWRLAADDPDSRALWIAHRTGSSRELEALQSHLPRSALAGPRSDGAAQRPGAGTGGGAVSQCRRLA